MNRNILQILSATGQLSASDAMMIEGFVTKWGETFFHAILECHLMTEGQLADALSEYLQLDRIYSLEKRDISAEAFQKLSYEYAFKWEVLPLGFNDENTRFHILMADPTQLEILVDIKAMIKTELVIMVGERSFVKRTINEYYPLELQIPTFVKECEKEKNRNGS